jgi:CheY-like chemotaxis protein
MSRAKRILVVDDNVDAADTTALLLLAHGFNVQVAYSGLHALATARASLPTLIFLDIGMPTMDGYDVAIAVRADEALRDVKLVALTAWGDEASRAKARAAGFDKYLTKPAKMCELIALAAADF